MLSGVVEYRQNKSHVEVVKSTKIVAVKTSNIKDYEKQDVKKISKKIVECCQFVARLKLFKMF